MSKPANNKLPPSEELPDPAPKYRASICVFSSVPIPLSDPPTISILALARSVSLMLGALQLRAGVAARFVSRQSRGLWCGMS
jgi:hypothetical protein